MTKEKLLQAMELDDKLSLINRISLPKKMTEVNLVRSDGIINKWDGSIKVDNPVNFNIEGKMDEYNRYKIKINGMNITAKESAKLVNVVNSILTDRKTKLEQEFNKL